MKKFLNKRTLGFTLFGGGLGFCLFLVYISLGSTWPLMCNPYLPTAVGAVTGAVMSISDAA